MKRFIKFHATTKEGGYAVEKVGDRYQIAFMVITKRDGKRFIRKISEVYSNGQMYSFESPFLADHAIRTEILPMYQTQLEMLCAELDATKVQNRKL